MAVKPRPRSALSLFDSGPDFPLNCWFNGAIGAVSPAGWDDRREVPRLRARPGPQPDWRLFDRLGPSGMHLLENAGIEARRFRACGRGQGFPIALDLRQQPLCEALGNSAQENPPRPLPTEGGVAPPGVRVYRLHPDLLKRNKSRSALQAYGLQFKQEPLKLPACLLPSLGREGRGRVLMPNHLPEPPKRLIPEGPGRSESPGRGPQAAKSYC